MADPILRLANQRIIKASADLEVQIANRNGSAPALYVLAKLKDCAAVSLAALAFLNLDDPADIIKAKVLQNEVKRYDEWFVALQSLIAEGVQLDRQQTDEDREELLDVLTQTPEGQQEAVELGLIDDIPRD